MLRWNRALGEFKVFVKGLTFDAWTVVRRE